VRALAVECRQLTCRFGAAVAVDGIDLSVSGGEVFGLLGPNGAGKTTTIRSIITLLPVEPGHIRVFGRDVATEAMTVRRLIGYVPQLLSVDGALTGRENVRLFAELYDFPGMTGRPGSTRSSARWGWPTTPTGWPAPTPAAWSGASSWPRHW
jgi:ABC-2 type transport system ATP-binding protein